MPLSLELKQTVAQKFNSRCIIDFKPYYDLHHILPKSLGGTDDESNLVPLCFDCHEKIHASGATNWIEYLMCLKDKRLNECYLASEDVLAKDWDTPEEDEAWKDL